jgi:hypothetical protein
MHRGRGAAGERLFDLLKKPAYRESWNRLIQVLPTQQEPATVFGRPDREKERAIREFMRVK